MMKCLAFVTGLASLAYAVYQNPDRALQSRSNEPHILVPKVASAIRLQRRAPMSGKPGKPSWSQSPPQKSERSRSIPIAGRSGSQSPGRPKSQENPRSPKSAKLTAVGPGESPSRLKSSDLPPNLQYPLRSLASLQNSPARHDPEASLLNSPSGSPRRFRSPSPGPTSPLRAPIGAFQRQATQSPRAQSPRAQSPRAQSPRSRSPSVNQDQAGRSLQSPGMLRLRLSSQDVDEINQAVSHERMSRQIQAQALGIPTQQQAVLGIPMQQPHAPGSPIRIPRSPSPPAAASWQLPPLVHSPSVSGSSDRSGGLGSESSRSPSPGPSSRSASMGDSGWYLPKNDA